jgi:transcription initiation factor TFIIB
MHENTKNMVCPECGCQNLISDLEAGELICGTCGIVVSSDLLNFGPEWRAFTIEQRQNRTRAGAPLSLTIHDHGLSTLIGWRNRDAQGKRMKNKDKYKFYRLRKWNRRSKVLESNQRNLAKALSEMSRNSYQLALPRNVLETASRIYRRALEEGYTRGRTIKGVAATSLYMACRQCNVIRTLEDIADSSDISKKEIARTYRYLFQRMKTDIPLFSHGNYISKFSSKLNLSGLTERLATNLLNMASEIHLTSGRGPSGITAACVYIACQIIGEPRTQGDVADTAQVTEVTIRNRYKELLEKLIIDIPV